MPEYEGKGERQGNALESKSRRTANKCIVIERRELWARLRVTGEEMRVCRIWYSMISHENVSALHQLNSRQHSKSCMGPTMCRRG